MAAWPQTPIHMWMHNACAQMLWLGDSALPVTASAYPRAPNTTYITSLRSGWFDYAAQESSEHRFISAALRLAGNFAKWMGLDRAVLVGNAPISTNIWTPQQIAEIPAWCASISQTYRSCFVAVRNVQPSKHRRLIQQLQLQGFVGIPARVVYEFDFRAPSTKKHAHLQRDKSALMRSGLQVNVLDCITSVQSERLCHLYQAIYLEKHSPLNAQYTPQFFHEMVTSNVMSCLALENADKTIVAFALLYTVDDTLTVPALGYDTATPIAGLYRLLFAAISQYAEKNTFLLNYSSGAGDFKRKRGGVPHMEYTLIRAPIYGYVFKNAWLAMIQRFTHRMQVDDLIALGA